LSDSPFQRQVIEESVAYCFDRLWARHFIPLQARIIASPANFVAAPFNPSAEIIPESAESASRKSSYPAPATIPAIKSKVNLVHIVANLFID